jgi:hypothetical protein
MIFVVVVHVCVCFVSTCMYLMWCDLTFIGVLNITILWDVMGCSLLESYRHLKAA